ncbi:MAG: hypothetical protein WCK67_04690 [bacterium]
MIYSIKPQTNLQYHNKKVENKNINNFSNNASSKSINFTGNNPDLATKIAKSIPDGVFTFKPIQGLFKLAQKDLALFDAVLTFALVASIRPLTIMAMPGASKEDKQYAATKAMAGGAIGLGLTALLFTPVTKAVKGVSKELFKGLANSEKKEKAFEYLMNYGAKFIIAPLQAFLLVESIHPIMDLVFPKKNKKTEEKKSTEKAFTSNQTVKSNNSASLLNILEEANKNKSLKTENRTALFSQKPTAKVTSFGGLQSFFDNLIKENPATKKTNLDTIKKFAPAISGLWLEGCYSTASISSDKIPKERKAPLVINLLFTGVTSAIGSIALAPFIEKCEVALVKRFNEINGIKALEQQERTVLGEGLKAMPHIAIAAILLHYICPVIATPIADKVNKFLIKQNILKAPDTKK